MCRLTRGVSFTLITAMLAFSTWCLEGWRGDSLKLPMDPRMLKASHGNSKVMGGYQNAKPDLANNEVAKRSCGEERRQRSGEL